MVKVIKYSLLLLLCVSLNSYADNISDNIDEWNYYQGIWVKKLPMVHLPKQNYFHMFTCYNSIRTYDGGKCTNRELDDIDDDDDHDHHYDDNKKVPEPGIVGLLGIGLVFMGVRDKFRRKL